MSLVMTTFVIVRLMSCAIVGGVFFAFSGFIMKLLSRLPSSEGIAAMQSISASEASAVSIREHYLRCWTRLDTLRTIAALAAALLFTLGLIGHINV